MRRGFEVVRGKVLGFYQAFGVGGKKYRFDPARPVERSRALQLATGREEELREREQVRRQEKGRR